jgi:hypothetical protein
MPESNVNEHHGLNEYQVDIKVYESAHRMEIPYRFPDSAYDQFGRLKTGTRSMTVYMNAETFDLFEDWCFRSGILKLLGSTPISISTEPPEDEPDSNLDLRMREEPSNLED